MIAEAIDAALWSLHKTQCGTNKVTLGTDTNEEEHLAEATSEIAHEILHCLANATCEDCLESLTDYSGKDGDNYDVLLMELFEQVADEMIRRSDEKAENSDEPDPLYTRDDLLKYVQEL